MLRSDYSYELPEELIAKDPITPRDHSRMMVLDRKSHRIQHRHFHQFPDYLEPGSILVINDSRVLPARLPGKRASGGFIELLLVEPVEENTWSCKVKNSSRLKIGETLYLCDENLVAVLKEKTPSGECRVEFTETSDLFSDLEKYGYAPIPPYIHKARQDDGNRVQDLINYQTIYADTYGSIAAPTAGFHFTPAILKKIKDKEIEILTVTLNVGLGTFEPIRVDDVSKHIMHEEKFFISETVAQKIETGKKEGRKIVTVGTTTVRTLESAWDNGRLRTGHQKTSLFIYPSYQYKVADQVLTNFHLPQSTLLMLVCAFGGKDFVMNAYEQAVIERYRFFSFGDCMCLL
ncbi:tRNA preQ1(34) S-adenosylmethionine ribosyltransferase-isomerase QueA [bacterium]|nr:tRNA preQ1(34) S-adenosylmethionine ribosyltransferase-isomerase QueA [bacterium]